MRARILSLILASTFAFDLVATGCKNDPPAEKPAVKIPPQLTADAATTAAMKDAKFAEYRKLVRELRAASTAMSKYLASIGGKPKSDGERERYAQLDADITAKREAVNLAMSDSARTDEDRKVMRILFAAPDAALTD